MNKFALVTYSYHCTRKVSKIKYISIQGVSYVFWPLHVQLAVFVYSPCIYIQGAVTRWRLYNTKLCISRSTYHNRQAFGDLFGQANFLPLRRVDFDPVVTRGGTKSADHRVFCCISWLTRIRHFLLKVSYPENTCVHFSLKTEEKAGTKCELLCSFRCTIFVLKVFIVFWL